MKNIDKDQESSNIFKICKLSKKTCIRTSQENRNSYTINEKRIKITMRVTKRESISTN